MSGVGLDPRETGAAILSAWYQVTLCVTQPLALPTPSLLCHLGSPFCHQCHCDLVSAIFAPEKPKASLGNLLIHL